MKKFLIPFLLIGLVLFLFSINFTEAYVRVRGYFRRDGTYVQPHYRTYPNKYKFDNWSSWGNYNPFTGKPGYRRW
jgi:hypothetical protein